LARDRRLWPAKIQRSFGARDCLFRLAEQTIAFLNDDKHSEIERERFGERMQYHERPYGPSTSRPHANLDQSNLAARHTQNALGAQVSNRPEF